MKRIVLILIISFTAGGVAYCQSAGNLKLVFIRHAEKPIKGDNLTCQGVNRAMQLPKILYAKFGIPAYTYVPKLGLGDTTKHARMFQTVMPLAAKYNLVINTSHAEKDSIAMAADLKSKKGTILIVWEHKAIAPIIRSLGIIAPNLKWPDDDFDSIWIVTFPKGVATLTKDKEGIHPTAGCSF
jgi:hypothetical protein